MRSFYSPDRSFVCPFRPEGVYVGQLACKICSDYIGQDQSTVYCNNNKETICGSKVKESFKDVIEYLDFQITNPIFKGECHLNENFKKFTFDSQITKIEKLNIEPMTLLEIYNKAYSIALEAHLGQVDKQGKPYFNHVLKVSKRYKTLEGQIVGILHDVLEDCKEWTPVRLIESGIPAKLVETLKILTRLKCEKYETYIDRIKTDPLAIEVKLADLKHNMDWTRNKTGITPDDIERTIKYHRHYVELYKCLPDHN